MYNRVIVYLMNAGNVSYHGEDGFDDTDYIAMETIEFSCLTNWLGVRDYFHRVERCMNLTLGEMFEFGQTVEDGNVCMCLFPIDTMYIGYNLVGFSLFGQKVLNPGLLAYLGYALVLVGDGTQFESDELIHWDNLFTGGTITDYVYGTLFDRVKLDCLPSLTEGIRVMLRLTLILDAANMVRDYNAVANRHKYLIHCVYEKVKTW